MRAALEIILVTAFAVSCPAQDRFVSGKLKGFTKSPTEHIIAEIEDPFEVRSVQGTIVFKGKDDPLKGVVFEIRGPGGQERIRATRTDSNGRFKIRRVPEGSYTFKATLEGFQSVVGTLVVSKKADRQKTIKIEMPVGV